MKKIFTAITLLLLFVSVGAQNRPWYEMMQDPNAKFEETVAAAEAYFAIHGTGKGTGWKQFKRWEWYMQDRLTDDGRQAGAHQTYQEFMKYLSTHPRPSAEKRNTATGTWTELGPVGLPANGTGQPNGIGRISSITTHPSNANILYAGAASGGFWISTDYGASWTLSDNGLPRLGVSSIVVHPTTTTTIYIGTGDRDGGDVAGYGVYRSTDGGATWAAHNTGMGNRTVYEILMDPGNSNIMIASCPGRIYRTTDGGANWNLQYSAGENFKDLAFHPGNSNIVYAGSNDYYRSTDNGLNWTQITSTLPAAQRYALAVSPNQPNWVYILTGDGGGFTGLYRSTDSGVNFVQQSNTPNILGYGTTGGTGSQAWYDLVLQADPSNANIIYAGGVNIWKSVDAGVNWTLSAHWTGSGGVDPVHADQHVLEWSPFTGDLINGNDGGVYMTGDGGTTWTDESSDLAISQVYKLGQAQTDKDLVICGYQDNGTAVWYGGTTWSTEIGGDGMECIVDPKDGQVMYGALYYGDIRRSTNGGASFGGITGGISESGAWVTPYKVNPDNPDTMYVGMVNMWRSFDAKSAGTPTWTQISSFAGSSTIRDVAIAPSNTNVCYIARNGSQDLLKSSNVNSGSPTWTDLSAALPGTATPKDIEIHPTNPDKLWIAYNNDIYQSTDGGASFTNFSGSLPNISLNTIVFDKNSPTEGMYVGMDAGVYYRDNTMADWVLFDSGIPLVEVTELEIYYDSFCPGNDMLRAATYGRGLWESDLYDDGTSAPIACFSANPTSICAGEWITFSDQTAYTPTSWSWTVSPGTYTFQGGTSTTDQNPIISFDAVGTYTVTLVASNGNGSDNMVRTNYITVTGSPVSLPISENWETGVLCGTASDCAAEVCALPNGWINETNSVDDDIDWRLDEGGTPSTNTGPSIDADPGTVTGNYVYTEASSCSGRTAILRSDCIDLTSAVNPEVTFSYHMYGADMGELHFDVYAGGTWNLDQMTVISGDQGNVWTARTVSLAPYVGQVVKVRWRGITGSGFTSDMALDNLQIYDAGGLDASGIVFEGRYVAGTGNVLKWTDEQAALQDRYELFRILPDGKQESLSRVSADNQTEYGFTDRSPLPGMNQYELFVTDQNGKRSFAGMVEIFTEMDNESVRIYPNPSRDIFEIDIVAGTSRKVELAVFDLTGRKIHSEWIELPEGETHRVIDLGDAAPGVYTVRVGKQSFKVVRI